MTANEEQRIESTAFKSEFNWVSAFERERDARTRAALRGLPNARGVVGGSADGGHEEGHAIECSVRVAGIAANVQCAAERLDDRVRAARQIHARHVERPLRRRRAVRRHHCTQTQQNTTNKK